jgi:hypothetical protein
MKHRAAQLSFIACVYFLLATILLSAVIPSVIRAQAPDTASQTTPTSTVSSTIEQTNVFTTQMSQLQAQYTQQLESYRTDERNFTLAKEQYTQLQTLTSLEDAVKSTKAVMESRLIVIRTYVQMLRLTLTQTTGIDLSAKTTQLTKIDGLVTDIKNHQTELDAASDRSQLQKVATDFAALQPKIQSVAFQSLSFIAYGKVRAVYDKTVAVEGEISDHVNQSETDALRLAEKKRGFDEVDRNLQSVDAALKKTFFNITRTDQKEFTADSYSTMLQDLNTSYAGISRGISFLKEILGT